MRVSPVRRPRLPAPTYFALSAADCFNSPSPIVLSVRVAAKLHRKTLSPPRLPPMDYKSDDESSSDDLLNFTPFSAPSVSTPLKGLGLATKGSEATMSAPPSSSSFAESRLRLEKQVTSSVSLAYIPSPIKSISSHLRWYKYGKIYYPVRTCLPEEASGLSLSQDGDTYDESR